MPRPEVKIRLATEADADDLKRLVKFCGFEFEGWEIDWTDANPHWLVADYGGQPMGCVQICYGRPIGRIEILGVDDSLDHRTRSRMVYHLVTSAAKVLGDYGAQAVSGLIPFEMKGYKRWLKRRGAITLCSGNLLMYRLR